MPAWTLRGRMGGTKALGGSRGGGGRTALGHWGRTALGGLGGGANTNQFVAGAGGRGGRVRTETCGDGGAVRTSTAGAASTRFPGAWTAGAGAGAETFVVRRALGAFCVAASGATAVVEVLVLRRALAGAFWGAASGAAASAPTVILVLRRALAGFFCGTASGTDAGTGSGAETSASCRSDGVRRAEGFFLDARGAPSGIAMSSFAAAFKEVIR